MATTIQWDSTYENHFLASFRVFHTQLGIYSIAINEIGLHTLHKFSFHFTMIYHNEEDKSFITCDPYKRNPLLK